jgi:hypothetical protein
MQTALMKARSKLDEHRVGVVYKAARDLFFNPELSLAQKQDQTTWRSRLVGADGIILVTCTDAETGLFVQLSGLGTATENDLMLTFGQKFCQEGRDMARQNIATKIWS